MLYTHIYTCPFFICGMCNLYLTRALTPTPTLIILNSTPTTVDFDVQTGNGEGKPRRRGLHVP